MTDWENIKLGNICEVVRGGSPRPIIDYITDESDGVNWLKIGDVKETDKFFTHANEKIKPSGIPKTREVKAGDLTLSNSMSFGRAFITLIDGYIHDGWLRLRCDESRLDKEYLYYFLTSNLAQNQFKAIATGSVVNNLKSDTVKAIKIDLPTLGEQKRIAEVLSMFDDKIKCNEEVNKNLEEQAQSIFKSWFIDVPESSSWETGTFSDIIDTTIAGDWGKDSPIGNNTEMVYCIRGADIPDVKSGNKGQMPTRFILPKNYVAKHLVAGDVVVEISGGSPTQSTGRIASISQSLLDRYNKGMVCTNFCKAMKPKSGYSMFVYYYWQYLYDKNVFFLYENGTTGIKNLDISGFIETEPIILPPVELVEEFDAFCHSIFDVIFANGLQNEKLANMRDALLPKLMSGEVDVSTLDL